MFTMTNFLISVFIFSMIITPVLLTMSGMIDEQKDVIKQYEQAMQVYEQEQANLQKQVADYRARADSLHADADELRMQSNQTIRGPCPVLHLNPNLPESIPVDGMKRWRAYLESVQLLPKSGTE